MNSIKEVESASFVSLVNFIALLCCEVNISHALRHLHMVMVFLMHGAYHCKCIAGQLENSSYFFQFLFAHNKAEELHCALYLKFVKGEKTKSTNVHRKRYTIFFEFISSYVRGINVSTYLESCLVPDGAVIECPGGGEQQHDGDQGVQHHGEDQRDQVEQGDVCEENHDVHRGVAAETEVTFGNLAKNET